jgi:lysophospholipase L1-like esterase
VNKGEKVAFLGDSITQAGTRKSGYVTLVMEALNQEGLELTHIPAGVSGNRSKDMLARLDRDVIIKTLGLGAEKIAAAEKRWLKK